MARAHMEGQQPSMRAMGHALQRFDARLFSCFNQISINKFVENAGYISLIGQAFIGCLFLQLKKISFRNPYI